MSIDVGSIRIERSRFYPITKLSIGSSTPFKSSDALLSIEDAHMLLKLDERSHHIDCDVHFGSMQADHLTLKGVRLHVDTTSDKLSLKSLAKFIADYSDVTTNTRKLDVLVPLTKLGLSCRAEYEIESIEQRVGNHTIVLGPLSLRATTELEKDHYKTKFGMIIGSAKKTKGSSWSDIKLTYEGTQPKNDLEEYIKSTIEKKAPPTKLPAITGTYNLSLKQDGKETTITCSVDTLNDNPKIFAKIASYNTEVMALIRKNLTMLFPNAELEITRSFWDDDSGRTLAEFQFENGDLTNKDGGVIISAGQFKAMSQAPLTNQKKGLPKEAFSEI